ncbi:phosphoribosyltransferase [Patescibacteria group bacterium]|nr:phosphoribosyltransferase [Patescibacteria group bacterium]
MFFRDRQDAGQKLAEKLAKFKNKKDTIIIGLPRGGIIVAGQVAKTLNLPLDIVIPRKISAPQNPEFAIGAISEDGYSVFDQDIIIQEGINKKYLEEEITKEKKEAQRRLKLYRGHRTPLDLKYKTAIIIDDGIATGSTMQAAILSVKNKKAKHIILAVPVLPKESLEKFQTLSEELFYVHLPHLFMAIGNFYADFRQITDQEVIEQLNK